MIIQASFYDNDFTQILEEFFDKFWSNIFLLTEKHRDDIHLSLLDNERYHEFEKLYKKTGENFKTLSKEDKQHILDYIKENILEYVNKVNSTAKEGYKMNPNTLKYLEKNLELKFMNSIKDEWKNGEFIYYFTGADKFITM